MPFVWSSDISHRSRYVGVNHSNWLIIMVVYCGIFCMFGCPYMINYCSSTKQVYMVSWVSWWVHCVLFSKKVNCSTPAYQMFHFNLSFYAMIELIWSKCSLYEFIMFICFYFPIAWTSHCSNIFSFSRSFKWLGGNSAPSLVVKSSSFPLPLSPFIPQPLPVLILLFAPFVDPP